MVQRPQVVDRDVRVELARGLPDRSERHVRLARRANVHHGPAGEIVFHEREEDLPRDVVAHAGVLRVPDDADDLDRRLRARIHAEADVAADRAAVAEIALRVAFVDDRHRVRRQILRIADLRPDVPIVEVAAGDERNAHCLEVAGADRVAVRVHALARLRLVAFHRHRAVPLVPLEQTDLREGHRGDARQRADAIQQLLVELLRADRRVTAEGRRDVERDEVVRLQTQIEQAQVPEAADEEAGAYQQHDRDGDLRHDEPLAQPHAARPAHDGADLILERRRQIRSGRAKRRHQAEHEARDQ